MSIEVSAHFVIILPKSTASDYHAYQQRYFAVRVRTVDYFGLVYWSNNCIHNTICSLGANHGDNPKSNNSQLTMSINGLHFQPEQCYTTKSSTSILVIQYKTQKYE